MKRIIALLMGLMIFEIVYSATEFIIVNNLGMKVYFLKLMMGNFKECIFIYFCICFCLFIFNFIYTALVVKKLNNKLNLLKKERGN